MTLEIHKRRKITLVVGKTGYGKSYLVKQMAEAIDRCVILDCQGEYDIDGYVVIDDWNRFKEHLRVNLNNPKMKVTARFDSAEEYEAAIEACMIAANLTMIIEEIHQFSSARDISEHLERLIRFGRHRSVSLIGVSQRFADLNLIIRNNLDLLICFNLSAPNDLKYLSELPYVGDEAFEIGNLPRYEYKAFFNI